ncbi:addiction module killer protein [Legionella impletisoli]|uniref:Addiction module killer protein n=2 Tax=Legionella impletisoli TaxID=343510 RepID=A0A917JRH9_9GAMM|nr:addiction module killer protein [Legionella impletisoli]
MQKVSYRIQLIMKELRKRTIKLYQKDNGDCPVISWLESLNDSVRYRVKSRLARVSLGNLGEYKMLGDSLGELKFKFGSGYRLYFSEIDGEIILLLCGGDKSSQKKDIKLAREYLNNYLGSIDHG